MHALLLQPYDTGSHRAWADGYVQHSSASWTVMRLPGRFWKWRMHGAAVTFAERMSLEPGTPDIVLTTDMLDLATLRGLAPWPVRPPFALYMHENQLVYPAAAIDAQWTPSRQRRAVRPEVHYGWLNVTSALAADVVFWNSAHNRDTFLAALPGFLRQFPDAVPGHAPRAIAAKSTVLPLGLDLWSPWSSPEMRAHDAEDRLPRLVWNHRWEHDKDPEAFLTLLARLVAGHFAFEVTLLGETFGRAHAARDRVVEVLGRRLVHDGFVDDREAYRAQLMQCDVVVSTARHEFFGASVCEAVWAGAWPVLPQGLGYDAWLPPPAAPEVCYEGADALFEQTVRALSAAATPSGRAARRRAHEDILRPAVAPLAWPVMAARYDAELAHVVRTARAEAGRPLGTALIRSGPL